MADAEQKTTETDNEKPPKEKLGEIEPVQMKTDNIKENNIVEKLVNNEIDSERSLLSATRALLRDYGIRKSAAAVRDAVEMPHDIFGPQNSVSALSSLGFKSSFGNMKLSRLTKEFLPLIAFMNDGSSVIVKNLSDNGELSFQKAEKIVNRDQNNQRI